MAALKQARQGNWLFFDEVKNLSVARDPAGLTALGCAAGAGLGAVAALLAERASALVPGDLAGASAGALAARAGQRAAADCLYRAASKAAARAQPLFRRIRSEIVVRNRVPGGLPHEYLPRDTVDLILEFCAAPAACWFAETPAPAAVAAAAAKAAAAQARKRARTAR